MNSPQQRAMLTFVVDVESARRRANPAGLLRLATLVDHYRIPASWSFPAESPSQSLELLLGRLPGADLVIEADASWVGAQASRSEFARALEQRVATLNRLGKHPSGISVSDRWTADYLDLLVKHKLRWVVEPAEKRSGEGGDVRQRSGRFGVWTARTSWLIPHSTGWRLPWSRLGNRRRLTSLVTARRPTVARLDLRQLLRSPQSWSELEDVFKAVSRWRSRGKLRIESLAGVSLVLHPPKRAAMRSILRPAA